MRNEFESMVFFQSIAELSKTVVPVVMNGEESWTLQPWHLKLALLNQGIFVNEDCIQIAEEIKGPNPAYEAKEFLITLSVRYFLILKCLSNELMNEFCRSITLKRPTSEAFYSTKIQWIRAKFLTQAGTKGFISPFLPHRQTR